MKTTATTIIPVTITHKQNGFNQPKCKVMILKEMEKYREIFILDEMGKGFKVKLVKQEHILKSGLSSIDNIPIIKEKLQQNIQLKAQRIHRCEKQNSQAQQNISRRPQNILSRNRREKKCKGNTNDWRIENILE